MRQERKTVLRAVGKIEKYCRHTATGEIIVSKD